MYHPIKVETQLFKIGKVISFLRYSWRLTEYLWDAADQAQDPNPRPGVHQVPDELRGHLLLLEARYAKPDGPSVLTGGLDSLDGRCCGLACELIGGFAGVVEGTAAKGIDLGAQEGWMMVAQQLDASIQGRIGKIAREFGEWLVAAVGSEDWEININLKKLTKEAESVSSVRAEQLIKITRGIRMALGLPSREAAANAKGRRYQSRPRAFSSSEDSGQESQPKKKIRVKRRKRPGNAKSNSAVESDSAEQTVPGLPNWFSQVNDSLSVLDELVNDMPFELRLLKLLSYDSMDSREDSIQDAEGSTFDWMLDDTASPDLEPELVEARESFIRWLKSGQGIFHISGKAGAGKSTLFKLLCNHRRTRFELQEWAVDSELVVASFFFWNSGNPMQTSLEGLFRSLLVQVSRQCPNLIPDLFPKAWDIMSEARASGGHVPDEALLDYDTITTAWNNLQELETDQYCMCFFIDGLDEYTQTEDGPSYEVFAKNFQDWAGRNSDVKFCVSSRPYADFLNAFSSEQRLHLHELTSRDIKAFANESFGSLEDARYRDITKFLVNAITERSEGVFVWVRTAVRSLLALMKRGAEPEVILNQVRKCPSDIYELYDYLLRSLQPEAQSEATHMIRAIIGNPFSQPPNALWLSWIDELDHRSFPDPSNSKPYTAGETSRRHDIVRGKLEWLTKGLLTMFTDRREPKNGDQFYRQRVQFFHRTARDFFRTPISSDNMETDPPLVGFLPMGEEDLTEKFLRLRLAEIVLAGKYRAAPGADPRRRRLYFNYLRSLFGLKDKSGNTFQIPTKYLEILRKDLQTTHELKFGSAYAVSGFRSVSNLNIASEDPEKPASFLHLALAHGQHEYALEELKRCGEPDDEGLPGAKGKAKMEGRSPPRREVHLLLSAAFGGRAGGRIPFGAFEALLPFAGDLLATVTMRPPISNDFLASVSREASVLLVFASALVFSCQRGGGGFGEGMGRKEVQNIQRLFAMLARTMRSVVGSGLGRTGADGAPTHLIYVLLKLKEAIGISDRQPSTTAVPSAGESTAELPPTTPTYYTTLREAAMAFGAAEDAMEMSNPDQGINDDARVFVPSLNLEGFVCTRVVLADGTSIGVEDDLCFRIY
ncbi:hypothetical protein VP1G_00550 [Cytospora mali]|uniref:NACHT domain-containing protein n=1 Tax=Cytospora mali TaxID=578113 RepID=A0A194UMN1_CYTMA|nr:hypothetical protein VP1G_00550 [Valsa mali var. pyri (nom. inval.)]